MQFSSETRTLLLNIICMQPSNSLNIYPLHLAIFKYPPGCGLQGFGIFKKYITQ